MPRSKKLRVFAGPNGSGKTSTLFPTIESRYNCGYFINADEIEKQLNKFHQFELQSIGIQATSKDLNKFLKSTEALSLLSKCKEEGFNIKVEISNNSLIDREKKVHSYTASFIAAFIRWNLYKKNVSFSFESVMSHSSKVTELEEAKKRGYKIYLYFICTDDPDINIRRVTNRVDLGGHKVNKTKIRSRYINSLVNLIPAIKLSNRTFLIDNSGKEPILLAEVFNENLQIIEPNLPDWFKSYILPHFH